MTRLWCVTFGLGSVWLIVQAFLQVAVLEGLGRIGIRGALSERSLVTKDGPALHEEVSDLEMILFGDEACAHPIPRDRDLMILFVGSNCSPCWELIGAVVPFLRYSSRRPFMVIVSDTTESTWPRAFDRHGIRVVVDTASQICERLAIERVPFGLLVDRNGVLRMKGVVNNREQLEGLYARRGKPGHHFDWQASGLPEGF